LFYFILLFPFQSHFFLNHRLPTPPFRPHGSPASPAKTYQSSASASQVPTARRRGGANEALPAQESNGQPGNQPLGNAKVQGRRPVRGASRHSQRQLGPWTTVPHFHPRRRDKDRWRSERVRGSAPDASGLAPAVLVAQPRGKRTDLEISTLLNVHGRATRQCWR